MKILEFMSLICMFQITYSCGKSIQKNNKVPCKRTKVGLCSKIFKLSRETPENRTGCRDELVPYIEGNIRRFKHLLECFTPTKMHRLMWDSSGMVSSPNLFCFYLFIRFWWHRGTNCLWTSSLYYLAMLWNIWMVIEFSSMWCIYWTLNSDIDIELFVNDTKTKWQESIYKSVFK